MLADIYAEVRSFHWSVKDNLGTQLNNIILKSCPHFEDILMQKCCILYL